MKVPKTTGQPGLIYCNNAIAANPSATDCATAPTIVTGITLAIARAAGETAPLLFTALYSNFWASNPPEGLIEPIATLSVLIYNFSVVPFGPQKQLAWSASLILVFLVLITSIASRLATREKTH